MVRRVIKDWVDPNAIENAILANNAGDEVYILHRVSDPMYDYTTWKRLRSSATEIFVISVASRNWNIEDNTPAMDKIINDYNNFRVRNDEISKQTRLRGQLKEKPDVTILEETRSHPDNLSEKEIQEFLDALYDPNNIEGHT